MRDWDVLGVSAERADSPLFVGVLKRGLENLVNRIVDLLIGGIEYDSAATTVHGESSGISRFSHSFTGSMLVSPREVREEYP